MQPARLPGTRFPKRIVNTMSEAHRTGTNPIRNGARAIGLGTWILLLVPPVFAESLPPPAQRTVNFERDIQPIFETHCYQCHGPKQQKGGLSLHDKSKALEGGDEGPPFETGKSEESRLIERVAALDELEAMPPKGKGKRLTPEQVGILRAWIDQGLDWPDSPRTQGKAIALSDHWAFKKPERSKLPDVKNTGWVRNSIDQFILARLEREGLGPAPEADRATLIRRLSLDLIGLPPELEEVDAFLADSRPDAYERLVERLLDSPHYGERWGRRWLDRARYADTNGYEKDRERSIWPYRDWVIQAINRDMPFDQFTVEQLAGDLLPNPTRSQKIATGFHRNTMTNEEGGIDVEEFRFASVVDRVATTGAVWLGLTIQCAQCHTHKYDPITQREYYQFFSFLNNADEPELEVPSAEITAKRRQLEKRIQALSASRERRLEESDPGRTWSPLQPVEARSQRGATLATQPDGSIQVTGSIPDTDTYELVFEVGQGGLSALRIEALADPSGKSRGPGLTPHGNFVLSEVRAELRSDRPRSESEAGNASKTLTLMSARADFAQTGFEANQVIDGKSDTGWAIDDGSGGLNKKRILTFSLREPISTSGAERLVLTLDQAHGNRHQLGRFRVLGLPSTPVVASANAGSGIEARLEDWESGARSQTRWHRLRPTRLVSAKHATLTLLQDLSVLATGDKPNNDVYEVDIPVPEDGLSAIRLEVLPDASLPAHGPGRAPLFSVGDFLLTEVKLTAFSGVDETSGRPVKLAEASEDYSEPKRPAALAIDGIPDTGWTIKGRTGEPHAAVFVLNEKLDGSNVGRLRITLHQEGIHQMTIGRFRLSATSAPGPIRASAHPGEIEDLLATPRGKRSAREQSVLKEYYLGQAPELADLNQEIKSLQKKMPIQPTTLVMQERAKEHARKTHIHKRGEFLKVGEEVQPGLPAVLPPLPSNVVADRLGLARWLVSEDNPLVGRVVINQVWQSFFGRGIVATVDDFGTRGEPPTHPELLDWLATEFPRRGWSMKGMHRLIVTSATYRQDSRVTSEKLARDPKNEWLARGPRFRVDAEVVRDIALRASGLLNAKVGGPSVFPPQPDGVTSLAYGQVAWRTSTGPDRYRRGLYTYTKRTAPYAAFTLMDAPTSETTCVRRERSNTPLQALTLLNDTVFVEAARALAERTLNQVDLDEKEKLRHSFRLCLTREPTESEIGRLAQFLRHQEERFERDRPRAAEVVGANAVESEKARTRLPQFAAWTTLARALLNLDETISKE